VIDDNVIPRRILGLDILPGSSPSASKPLFAAALLIDNRVVEEYGKVSLEEIAGIVEKNAVEALALDNIFELAPDEEGVAYTLYRHFERMPRIIQTTLIRGESYPLETLCSALGLCREKPGPLETARINALLARRGIGSEALIFEEETRITVSRGRVPGQGGMSRERYKRNLEMLVLRKKREIEEKLRKAGIDYDVFVRKSGAGLESATFIAYVSRDKLYGIVRPSRGYDLQVEIEPVKREKIEFVPLRSKASLRRGPPNRYLIVGVDPGMSTGVAILDLAGRPLLLLTRRWAGRNQLAELLHSYGHPVIIAADVNPPPSYVKKLSSMLKARLFYPARTLSVEEKRSIASRFLENYGIRAKDSHQRDALAAAVKAYQHFHVKLDQVEREARRLGVRINVDEAKLLVLQGFSVTEALRRIIRRKVELAPLLEASAPKEEAGEENYKLVAEKYRRALDETLRRNEKLEKRVKELEEKLLEEKERSRELIKARQVELYREREYSKLRLQLRNLRERLRELEETLTEKEDFLSRIGVYLEKVYGGEAVLAPRFPLVEVFNGAKRPEYLVVDEKVVEDYGATPLIERLRDMLSGDIQVTLLLDEKALGKLGRRLDSLPAKIALLPEQHITVGNLYIVNPSEIRPLRREEPTREELVRFIKMYKEMRKRELLAKKASRG